MKTIEIDFDVHKLIELERRGFDEPENSALRRLLKLPAILTVEAGQIQKTSNENRDRAVGVWSWKGVSLPEGTKLRMEYAGQVVHGEILAGFIQIEGRKYKSPSDAAGSSVLTKDGTHPSLNGWMYWEARRPSDVSWRKLETLKPR